MHVPGLHVGMLGAATVALTACAFDTSNVYRGDDVVNEAADAAPGIDAGTTTVVDASSASPDANAAPTCDPQLSDLVLCMRFEDSAGATTLLDESQYGNSATVSNASFAAGFDGQALQGGTTFDSVIAKSSSLDVTAGLSMEMWIRPDEDITTGRWGLFDNNGQYGFFLVAGNALRCSASGGPNLTTSGGAVQTLQWQHVACTYDGSVMKLYVDGAEVGSANGIGQISVGGTDGSSLGQNSPDGDEYRGRMDTLRVWDVARTRAELCAGADLACP